VEGSVSREEDKKWMNLYLYRVYRPIFLPRVVLVFAKSKEEAKEIINKRYGHDHSMVDKIRIKKGLCFEENRR